MNRGFSLHYHEGDLFELAPKGAPLAHCVSADLKMGAGIAKIFKQRYGGEDELRAQSPTTGSVVFLEKEDRKIYYLVTKSKYYHKPTALTLKQSLEALRAQMIASGETEVWMPKIACGLDKMNWEREVLLILQSVFMNIGVHLHVCVLNEPN